MLLEAYFMQLDGTRNKILSVSIASLSTTWQNVKQVIVLINVSSYTGHSLRMFSVQKQAWWSKLNRCWSLDIIRDMFCLNIISILL
jgi:hypothetical protein